jgi:hypothetical protein
MAIDGAPARTSWRWRHGMATEGAPVATAARVPAARTGARARRVVPISGSAFGPLTKNRSSLEPSLGFAAITGTPRIENGAALWPRAKLEP